MTPIDSFAILLAMLFVKHFAADGPLQTSYQLANKGIWMHPGGLLHAGVHTGLSALVVTVWGLLFAPTEMSFAQLMAVLAILILPFEMTVHYLTDYGKCRLDAQWSLSRVEVADKGRRRLVIENTDAYFVAFLADQMIHALTMIAMVVMIAGWTL